MVSILINEQVQLRSYVPADAPGLFHAIDRNRAHLRRWLAWVDGTTQADHSAAFIEHSLAQMERQEGIALGIFHNDRIIGGLGMLQWDHMLRKAQVGYWIDKTYEGQGMVSICLGRFLEFLFTKLNLNKTEVQFVVSNVRSRALAERLGFRIEGVLRESYLVNGKLEDLLLAGLLKKEWSTQTTGPTNN